MKLKITKQWHTDSSYEGVLFFAQRLSELLFDYTLDTYKPPALNSVFLCREAIDLIVDIEQELLDRNNLTVVLDELDWSLRNDDVAKLILNAPVEKFILKGDDIKLAELKIRLEVLERVLSPMNYVETCQWLLVNAIKTGKEKKLISNLSRTLVS